METYKFHTTVQEDGVIQIPELSRFAHRKIEILVVIDQEAGEEPTDEYAVEHFLDRWRGFLRGFDAEALKFQYLREKYE